MKFYPHTATLPDGKPDPVQGHWQLLSTHVRNVPQLAKEFVLDYVEPFREGTAPCASENHVIPAFLEKVFDRQQSICATDHAMKPYQMRH